MRMNNLFEAMVCICFIFCFVNCDLNSQSFLPSGNYIMNESVNGNDLGHFKTTVDGMEIIFRDDRIEFFTKKSINEEQNFFLLFEDSKLKDLIAGPVVKNESVKISNPAMANVLGSEYMQVVYHSKITYKDLYPGVDLEISLDKEEINFNVLSNKDLSTNPVNLVPWGNDFKILEQSGLINVNGFSKGIHLSSDKASLEYQKAKGIQFSNTNKSLSRDFEFTISLK